MQAQQRRTVSKAGVVIVKGFPLLLSLGLRTMTVNARWFDRYTAFSRDGAFLNLLPMPSFGNWLDRAGFVEFFFHTREQAGYWRRAGVREVQRAVDRDRSKGLLSVDATECTWCPKGIEF